VVVSGALVFLAASAAAQQPPKEKLLLLNQSEIRVPDPAGLSAGAVQCDYDGALFLRLSGAGSQDPMRAPVLKISPTGMVDTKFSLSNVPRFDLSVSSAIYDFAATDNGQLYYLAQRSGASGKALYVIRFSRSGRYLSTLKLDHYFVPLRFTVLPGGSYFLLGMARDAWDTMLGAQAKNALLRPIGAFYGPKGTLRWELNLPGAAMPVVYDAKDRQDMPTEPNQPPIVAAAADGEVYVVSYKPALSLYVIGGGGAAVHSITIEPPFPGARITAIAPVSVGKVAVEFVKGGADGLDDGNAVFSVVDAGSGIRLVDYQTSPETTGRLGCYTQNGFELLASQDDGQMVIRFVRGSGPNVLTKTPSYEMSGETPR
jgi:hypothetical protein